jgi:putative PIN family toxin of toxin-antitoxin system
MFKEYEDVLRRPKFRGYSNFDIRALELLDDVNEFGKIVEPDVHFRVCTDPDDDEFLDTAVAANAEYLITGNKRDFPPYSFRGVRIVSPTEFLSLIK